MLTSPDLPSPPEPTSHCPAALALFEELTTLCPDTGDARTQAALEEVLTLACDRVTAWI
ncbi:hypothetical protein BJY21_003789 [Kineosphaera limosa]|uniref:Uncharacterized protein n=1 Tax=Kineosphaera limosa NBRC 100340 TaxID=1184609 RepID=K6XEF1_9MICO|nr:hypothetical protein [Kineosphaera limosa]NYE02605.1 hypothetical protein [Kineosphaera limosa]GAB97199.1 hypothetical protein KILIM_059_00180 [Kineosphaera limosa NBRC 100340]